jgi:hypothetical protein
MGYAKQGEEVLDSFATDKPEGPISASILAAGIGTLALGVLTTLAEASATVKEFLTFNQGVGPLSGKTILTVAVWLGAWAILHPALKNRPFESRRALVLALIMIALGLLLTFPPLFQLFASE